MGLFEFVHNTVLNANDWANTFATPPLHRNRFSGAIGGPIIKNKTFFFCSYAGLRQVTGTFFNGALVPTGLEHNGDFPNRRWSHQSGYRQAFPE